MSPPRFPRAEAWTTRVARASIAWMLFLWVVLGAQAWAQADSSLDEVLGGLGTAAAVDDDAPTGMREGEGAIAGRLVDGESGAPIANATVIVTWPANSDRASARAEIQLTDIDGSYEFASIPPGVYGLSFVKSGYRASVLTNLEVLPGRVSGGDFPMPRIAVSPAGEVLDLDAYVVDVSSVDKLMSNLELRLDSDQLLNTMSAEDLSKFASSDVAEALRRVSGVNIVEGQFAIIRGLEDRYSSTLFNGAPLPSPDPSSQSVQLDLFPSEVVANLVVAKTFAADSPGNSAGGSIDITTIAYPEALEIRVNVGAGFEENALKEFLGYRVGSPTGVLRDDKNVVETDMSASIGGRTELFDRELRFKAVYAREIDYRTRFGYQEGREPRRRNLPPDASQSPPFLGDQVGGIPFQSGELSYGLLSLSDGRFGLTQSGRKKQDTAYGGFGFDFDEQGNHRVDLSVFYTKKKNDAVVLKQNGYIPGFDYQPLVDQVLDGDFEVDPGVFNNFATIGSWIARDINPGDRSDKHQWFANMTESQSADVERDLLVYQLNGSHEFDSIDGLFVSWSGNQAQTQQEEEAIRSRITNNPGFIPAEFPVREQGPLFVANNSVIFSATEIEENQDFARLDLGYDGSLFGYVDFSAGLGGWYERAKRSVDSSFLADPVFDLERCRADPTLCQASAGRGIAFGSTLAEVGHNQDITQARSTDGSYAGNQDSRNDSKREIWAVALDAKLRFWDDVDLVGGLRIESINIVSENDARFLDRNGDEISRFGSKDVFPSRYLFFDRQDNPLINELPPRAGQFPIFNDQILGIDVPVDPDTGFVDFTGDEIDSFIDGEIDELFFLPTVGLSYRPIDGMAIRAAYSQTVARPSFRELGYYVTIPIGSSGLEVGNPQLGLSEVENIDGRVEYSWGSLGDLFAFSAFYKVIENPIERIVVRDPVNSDDTSLALFRTFFNNPNKARLWGIELEFRKNLGFLSGELFGYDLPDVPLLEYFSVGGNYTYIDAKVRRTEAQLLRADGFFGTLPGDPAARFTGLSEKRRLFGQPEWIVNADISFVHPGWGTRLTLAFFAISDVLQAAGSAGVGVNGQVNTFTIDKYVDSFHQLDLVFRRELWAGFEFKASIKNLTDSVRGVKYDTAATAQTYFERRWRRGRDYSFALVYSHSF